MPNFTTPLLSFLASSYLRVVRATSQFVWVNRSVREELEATGRGFIYTFWHGRQAFLVVLHENDRIHPMISKSKDGELIARICRSFGIEVVRGSSSNGGVQALLEMKNIVESGDRLGLTPDGPRGPLRQVQPGVLFLAQKTGVPIVPVAYGAKKRWIFRGGWDEFLVPKPFNRIAMLYGEPITVLPTDDLAAKATELQRALNEVTRKADSVSGAGRCN